MDSFFDFMYYIYMISAGISAGSWVFILTNPVARAFIESELPSEGALTFFSTICIFLPALSTIFALAMIDAFFSRRK